ncbi:MAG: HNH endonuclease [archaeon]
MDLYGKCLICGLPNEKFLITSHIKPWRFSTDRERQDPNNCFLLCPHHDALFDKGYISFCNSGNIIISDKLDKRTKVLLNVNSDILVNLNEGNQKYLEWHRQYQFLK